jgi:hypothetical protein
MRPRRRCQAGGPDEAVADLGGDQAWQEERLQALGGEEAPHADMRVRRMNSETTLMSSRIIHPPR